MFHISVSYRFIDPQLERINGKRYLFEGFLDLKEISVLIGGNTAVFYDLEEAVLFFVHAVEGIEGLDRYLRQVLHMYFRDIMLADGAFLRAVIVAQLGRFIAFCERDHVLGLDGDLAVLDLL